MLASHAPAELRDVRGRRMLPAPMAFRGPGYGDHVTTEVDPAWRAGGRRASCAGRQSVEFRRDIGTRLLCRPGRRGGAMQDRFQVAVGAGSMRSTSGEAVRFPHRWTPDGVTVEADFTGAHLLHLAAAGCVLNDVYREAAALGIDLAGVRVRAAGGFDVATWTSTGITYSVELSSDAAPAELARLLEIVDEVAEIPRAVRAGAAVRRAT
jgi:uncharacterized OsmC-like protein